jgi:ribosomal protein L19E
VRQRVQHLYHHRLNEAVGDEESRLVSQGVLALEKRLRLRALQVEREELARLRERHQINDETYRVLMREIDMVELVLRGATH